MQRDRLVPTVGLGATVAVLLAFLAPYVVAAGPAVTVYYTRGLVNGFGVVLLTGVALLLFARAALAERPLPLAAGVLAGVGLFTVALAATWAVTVPPTVVMGLSRAAELAYHRWALLGCAGVVAVVALVHARAAYPRFQARDGP